MLLTVINESDPIFQMIEYGVNNYIDTLDESVFDEIVFSEMSDRSAMSIINKEGKNEPPSFLLMRDEAVKAHPKNPFAAAKMIDQAGDLPSRAQGIGVHQPQKETIKSVTFWTHPTTRKAMKYGIPASIASIAAIDGIRSYKKHRDEKGKLIPPSVIAKKIASLRKLLKKCKDKLTHTSVLQEKNILQKAIVKISDAIDKLLAMAEQKSNRFFNKSK